MWLGGCAFSGDGGGGGGVTIGVRDGGRAACCRSVLENSIFLPVGSLFSSLSFPFLSALRLPENAVMCMMVRCAAVSIQSAKPSLGNELLPRGQYLLTVLA